MHQVQFLGSGKDILSPIFCQVALGSVGATDQGKRGNPVQSDRQLARAGPRQFPTEGRFFPLFSCVDSFCVAAIPGGEHLAYIAQQLGHVGKQGAGITPVLQWQKGGAVPAVGSIDFFCAVSSVPREYATFYSIHLTRAKQRNKVLIQVHLSATLLASSVSWVPSCLYAESRARLVR